MVLYNHLFYLTYFTVMEARCFKGTIIKVLGSAKFQLHKWHSNVKDLEHCRETDNFIEVEKKPSEETSHDVHKSTESEGRNVSTIIAVNWNKAKDSFVVNYPEPDCENTKRGVLKYLASIFDPLGNTSPVSLKGKILYRHICDNKISWDTILSGNLLKEWERWTKHLP